MNKQELEHQIKNYTFIKECAEERLAELLPQLAELLPQLAEAEKLKLEHGDVIEWANSEIEGIRIAWKSQEPSVFDTFNSNGKKVGTASPNPVGNFILHFNIFKLMKEWEKDFKGFEKKVYQGGQFNMRIIDNDIEFFLSGHATANLIEAEEIWLKLGTALFILKRKQGRE